MVGAPGIKAAIGVLAFNEERAIADTLKSLQQQSVFTNPGVRKEVIVIANGCTDRTSAIAREALAPLAGRADASVRVVDLAEAGKANAWNVLVHRESAADADYFVLLDADIEFAGADVIERLLSCLALHPDAEVATDQPTKRFGPGGGLLRTIIRMLQKSASDGAHAISGQLYAARAKALRAIEMPVGVVVEDGFLRAMILTDSFRKPEQLARIRRAEGAAHYYHPYEDFKSIYRYERRQAAGTAINKFLYDTFRQWRAEGLDIAAETRRLNGADPQWVSKIIAARVKGGEALVPRSYAFRRLRSLKRAGPRAFLKTPLILAATLYDFVVARAASRQLKERAGAHWDTIRTVTEA
jgi:glycosyltransferase involved in cell wall biosynthesis